MRRVRLLDLDLRARRDRGHRLILELEMAKKIVRKVTVDQLYYQP